MSAIDSMVNLLGNKCGFEPIEVSNGTTQVKILARVRDAQTWALMVHKVKQAELDAPWTVDVSQLLFLRTASKSSKLVKAWRLIVKSNDLEAAYAGIQKAASAAGFARQDTDEYTLPGNGAHRSGWKNGKGAAPLGG